MRHHRKRNVQDYLKRASNVRYEYVDTTEIIPVEGDFIEHLVRDHGYERGFILEIAALGGYYIPNTDRFGYAL